MLYICIELTTPEQYEINPDLFPTITHTRLASFTIEVPRMDDGKLGSLSIWFEKGFLVGTNFHLAPAYPGVHVLIEEPELWAMIESPIAAGVLGLELMRVIHQYCVDTGRIAGTVMVLEG